MNWRAVIMALNEEAIIISRKLDASTDYSQQRQIDLTIMQTCVMLAKCLQTGVENQSPFAIGFVDQSKPNV